MSTKKKEAKRPGNLKQGSKITNKPIEKATKKMPDSDMVMKELHAVLAKFGMGQRIDTMTFTGGGQCDCGPGCVGEWRVVGGVLICVPVADL